MVPAWLDELHLEPGPPHLSMGLRRLDPDRWLLPDEHRAAELDLKARLLAERHDEVFAALPGTSEAGAEVLELVAAHLGCPTPEAGDLHALDLAGRLVQEDLCLMTPDGDGYVLGAASLCFPSHWRLHDKLGRPTAAIHGPVPGYETELAGRVDRFLARLRTDSPVWRRNWTIHDHDELFAPEPPASRRDRPDVPDGLWLRSERQTLRRLPRTAAIVFTIRTQQVPLRALESRPDLARRLAAKLHSLPPDQLAGRAFGARAGELIAWLRPAGS